MKIGALGTAWPEALRDPSGARLSKPRKHGLTMVMDKGLGIQSFQDLLDSAAEHIDVIKLGFGTSLLIPIHLLQKKTELANQYGVLIMPGGTLLEASIIKGMVESFFLLMKEAGFTAIEVSDGTIDLSRNDRSKLIQMAKEHGFTVCTEYGKKLSGSRFDVNQLEETLLTDLQLGAQWMTLEGRESGADVGIFNQEGNCDSQLITTILEQIAQKDRLMWEAPRKEQQVHLIKCAGGNINIGNVSPADLIALEALRRGLRSDTLLDHSSTI